jgi:hypothetical protein
MYELSLGSLHSLHYTYDHEVSFGVAVGTSFPVISWFSLNMTRTYVYLMINLALILNSHIPVRHITITTFDGQSPNSGEIPYYTYI